MAGTATTTALVGAFEYLPYVLFGLVGGVLADQLDRRRLMMATSSIRLVVVLLAPVLHFVGLLQPWHLAAIAFIQASASAFFTPARAALLVGVLPEPDYQRGAAAYSATMRSARILGPLLGSALLRVFPPEALFFLVSALFLGSILTTWAIWLPERPGRARGSEGLVVPLVAFARKMAANRALSWSMAGYGLGMVPWTGLYTVGMALLAEQRIGGGESTYALLATAYGFGNVLANVLLADRPIRNRTAWIFGSWLFFAAGFLVLGWTTSLYIGLVAVAVAAAGGPMSDLAMSLKIRAEVPEADLGKAHSLWYTGMSGGAAIGLLLFGPVFDSVSVTAGFTLGALCLACLGLGGVLAAVVWARPIR